MDGPKIPDYRRIAHAALTRTDAAVLLHTALDKNSNVFKKLSANTPPATVRRASLLVEAWDG